VVLFSWTTRSSSADTEGTLESEMKGKAGECRLLYSHNFKQKSKMFILENAYHRGFHKF